MVPICKGSWRLLSDVELKGLLARLEKSLAQSTVDLSSDEVSILIGNKGSFS